MAAARTLSTAEDRRETILQAAERSFAARGLHGTPTIEIARAAGISQAYLFRLFPTKSELFLALVRRCNDRIYTTFAEAAAGAHAAGEKNVMRAIGHSYQTLIADRDLLLNHLNAHAACDDPDVRDEMRRSFAQLVELVERESGADPETVRRFFAHGMLMNVLTAMGTCDVDAHWADVLMTPPGENGP